MYIAFIVAGGVFDWETEISVDQYSAEVGGKIIEDYSEDSQRPKDTTIADAKVITSGYVRTGPWVWVNDSINNAMDSGIWAAAVRRWGGEEGQR